MRITILLLSAMLAFCAPAHAEDDDISASRALITSQIDAIGRDDAAAAFDFASPAIQEVFPQPDTFLDMVRKNYAAIYRHKSFEFGTAKVSGGIVVQLVHIVDGEGVPWDAVYTLEHQIDGRLKITGCILKKSASEPV